MSSKESKANLRLLLTKPDLKPRNYWNTVGLNREFFPTEPRQDSIPTINKHGRIIHEPNDPWWINSEKHHFCFWTYLKDRSQPDGAMEPLLQPEIAELFGCSSTKVHFMLKEAMDKLTSEENMKILQNLIELTFDDPETNQTAPSFTSQLESSEEDDTK